jgi:hypothetical protein
MNESVKHALSIVTKSQLRFVSLVNTNIRCSSVSETVQGVSDAGEEHSLVHPVYAELQKLYYICLGKHSFFILARNMESNEENDGFLLKLPYNILDGIDVMPENVDSELFVVKLASKPENAHWCPSHIYFRSPARKFLVGQIQICWKTDYMFQHLKVGIFKLSVCNENLLQRMVDGMAHVYSEDRLPDQWSPAKNGIADSNLNGGSTSFVSPHPSMSLLKVKSYEFYANKDFSAESKRNEKQIFFRNRGKKSNNFQGEYFWVRALPPVEMSAPRAPGEETIQSVADGVLKSTINPYVRDYRIIGTPASCIKHGNPCGDIASWTSWMVRIRTLGSKTTTLANTGNRRDRLENKTQYQSNSEMFTSMARRDITIIVCRRAFIPPTMDTAQDILIVFFGEVDKYGSKSAVTIPQSILDTLTPTIRGFECDEIVVQTKADALLLSEEDYSWFLSRLRIKPKAWTRGLEFSKSLIFMLERAGLTGLLSHPSAVMLFQNITLRDDQEDPFEFAKYLEKEATGLPDTAPPEIFEEWKRRVWRFISWCIDGGVLPSVLSIQSLVYYYNVLAGQPRPQSKLSQIFENILYLKAPNEPYVNSPLVAKVRDERLMRKFTFNEYVMIRLIESGYMKTILTQNADKSEYPRFLIRLLQRKPTGSEGKYGMRLKYSIAKQIVQFSMTFSASTLSIVNENKSISVRNESNTGPLADDVSINIIIPTLFRLLIEDDENLQILATVSLVNYTLKNAVMKNVIMAGGILRRIIGFLVSKNNDLVRHACALLNNCTKTEQYRQTVASFQVIPMLLLILQPSTVPPTFRPVPILVNTVAVLGNLAADSGLREKILESVGSIRDRVGAVRDSVKTQKLPTIIVLLSDLLNETADIDVTTSGKKHLGSSVIAGEADGEVGTLSNGDSSHLAEVEPLQNLYFHTCNTLKNLSVKIKDGETSNKRYMRFALPNIFRILQSTHSVHLQSVILELFYVLSFDKVVLHEMYSKYQLRVVLEKIGEKNAEGLQLILKDLKRLHDGMQS